MPVSIRELGENLSVVGRTRPASALAASLSQHSHAPPVAIDTNARVTTAVIADSLSDFERQHTPAAAAAAAATTTTANAARMVLSYSTTIATHGYSVLACLAAANACGVTTTPCDLQQHAVSLTMDDGATFVSADVILRCLGRAASSYDAADAVSCAEVDYFLELAKTTAAAAVAAGTDMDMDMVAQLDGHLTLRTFVAGHALSVADFAMWAMLKAAKFTTITTTNPHVCRWYQHVESLQSAWWHKYVATAAAPAPAPGGTTTTKGGAKVEAKVQGGSFDIDLVDASEGNVVTRFPPEPSGYLHIGHAKAALLNHYFARHYKGKMILRFDDTNPSKEKQEFVDNIYDDLRRIGVDWDMVTHTSDHFDTIMGYADRLVTEGKAYADTASVDVMRQERMDGVESACRNATVAENMRLWTEMKAGERTDCVLRIKMNMQNPNKCCRDPTIYRSNVDTPHHRTGTKYKVYPLYDFACPLVDSIEGVTHALRTTEYHDRDEQFQRMQEICGVRKVHIWEYARLNFTYTLMSKRKLQWFVDQGFVEGWNDPRFPTVQGILRRGLTMPALREFIRLQGPSKTETTQEWDKIWSINKSMLDPVVPRYNAVETNACVTVELTDVAEAPEEEKEVPRHLKNPALGVKKVRFTRRILLDTADNVQPGEEVTLMGWGNAVLDTAAGVGHTNLGGDFKKTKKKLQWVAVSTVDSTVPLRVVQFDHLITARKLDGDTDIAAVRHPHSRLFMMMTGEPALKEVKTGDHIQLQRKGYFRCDAAYDAAKPDQPMVLFHIPDGRVKKMFSIPVSPDTIF